MLLFLFAVLSGLAFSVLSLGYKAADAYHCRTMAFIMPFTLTSGIIALIGSCWQANTWQDPRLWWIGLPAGVLLFFAIYIVVRANQLGPASISWTFVNISLLVPIGISTVVLHERLYPIDLLSIALFILMLLAFARSIAGAGEVKSAHRVLFTLALLSIFIVNGTWMFGSKLKEHVFHDVNTFSFIAIVYLTCAVLSFGIYLLQHGWKLPQSHELKIGIGSGVASVTGILLFVAAAALKAAILYPVSQGISLLGGVMITAILYRERVDAYKMAGFVLGIAVLMISVLRG